MTQISGPDIYKGQYIYKDGPAGQLEEQARKLRCEAYDYRKVCSHPEESLSISTHQENNYKMNIFVDHRVDFKCYHCGQEWAFYYEAGIDRLAREYHNKPLPKGYTTWRNTK
jgi:hypothetical protein